MAVVRNALVGLGILALGAAGLPHPSAASPITPGSSLNVNGVTFTVSSCSYTNGGPAGACSGLQMLQNGSQSSFTISTTNASPIFTAVGGTTSTYDLAVTYNVLS